MKNSNKTGRKLLLMLFFLFSVGNFAFAQDDLLQILEEEEVEGEKFIGSTFKGTRLINGHSVETRDKGALDFIISHRFGTINSGVKNLFGLDDANIRLGLDYSLTDRFTIGVGRSSFQKVYDGFLKYRLLRQGNGGASPVSVVMYSNMSINSLDWPNPEREYRSSDRYAFTHQLLVARKFSNSLSFQIMPSLVHRNLVSTAAEDNLIYAIGIGGRQKLTPSVALTFEYYYQFNNYSPNAYQNPIAIGFDIETGGHVFQLHFTNSRPTFERGFMTETTGDFFNGDIHFGFNITRTFQLHSKRR
ncbi:MAG: DUF5777 family beta-barrel protein [Cyclobacteriaceae bacterium]